MNKTERKELLKAVLQGDKATVNRLTKGKTLYFLIDGHHYCGDLQTPITTEQFNNEYRHGVDSLFEFSADHSEQIRLMQEFGASPEEIAEQLAKYNSPEQTVNEIINLKNKFENEI